MSKKKKARPRPSPESLGLPPVGVDTHAHLDMDPGPDGEGYGYAPAELGEVLARARTAGVARVGNVFLGPDAYARHKALFDERPEVFFILGVHPHDASSWDADTASAVEAAFRADPRIRALGETGMDFHYDYSPRPVQERVFREQLELARQLDAPPVIHCREALAETLAVLDDMGFRDRPLVWHCFAGGPDMARGLLERGWTVSAPGAVTWKRSDEVRAAMAEIPLERMVLETDCPFLAPDPYRGKRNEPALAAFTAAAVASAKGLEPAEVWRATAATAGRVLGLDSV